MLFAGNLVKPFADLLTQTNSTGLTSSTTFLFLLIFNCKLLHLSKC